MKEEGRLIFEQMSSLFERLWSQFMLALLIAVLVTLAFLLSSQWNTSDAFVTNLVTVNSLLIASVAFLANFVIEGTRYREFVKRVEEHYWEAMKEKKRLEAGAAGQIHSWNITFLILLPAIAMVPFFISVILALGALVTSGGERSALSGLALWLMLWSFLSIMFSLWKIAIRYREIIKSL